MRALILTAGLGTRLRPLTFVRAKAAVPVNGEPIVRRLIAWLVAEGFTDLVLNLHHRPESIAAVVGDGQDLGARVRYSWENPVLGSAGGPRHALPLLTDARRGGGAPGESEFLLINGDTLTHLRLHELVEAHRTSRALVTMALTRNERPDLYGGVLVDNGRVTGFTRRGAAVESFHFLGVQVADGTTFASLEDGRPAETVMQLYPELIHRDSAAIAAHIVDAPFKDVGTAAEYWHTSVELATIEGDRLVSRTGVSVDGSARLRRTVVWDHVTIGPRSQLEDCIVCEGVRLPEDSHYTRSAIARYAGETLRPDERVEAGLIIKPF